MKISGFHRYVEQNDLRSIGAPKIRALTPRHVFSASRACARVSSEVEIKDYAVKLSFSVPLNHMYIVVAWPCCDEG